MKYIFFTLILSLISIGSVYATDGVIVRQKIVQFEPNTYLGLQGYYSHGQALRSQKLAEDSEALKELKEQNRILKELVNAVLAKNAGGSVPNVPEQKPEEPQIPSTTPLEQSVYNIFNKNCVRCHGDVKADGGLKLISNNKLNDINLQKMVKTHHRVNGVNLNGEARMPKGSPALSDDDVETIRMWVVEKAINTDN